MSRILSLSVLLLVAGCDRRLLVGTMDQNRLLASAGGYPSTELGGPGGGGGALPANGTCDPISTAPGTLNLCGQTSGVAFSLDGQLLATGTQTKQPDVHIWRLSDGAHVRDLDGIAGRTYDVAFSPDGRTLAVVGEAQDGGGSATMPGLAKLYDVASGALLYELPVNSGSYSDSVAFSPDGTLVATAGYGTAVEVWRVSDGSRVTRIPYPTSVHHVHFSPTGAQLIVAGVDQRATVWNVPSGTLVLTLTGIADEMADAAFSPDGSQIASTGSPYNSIKIWDVASGALLQTMAGHAAYVSRVVWIDQDRFLTDDWSGVVIEWSRTASGSFERSGSWWTGGQALGMAVSPDKTRFAVGGGISSGQGFVFEAL